MQISKSFPVLTLALLGACTNQMEPAKQALETADNAVSTASSPDASQYDAENLAALKSRLAILQAAFDRKDYATVLVNGSGLTAGANGLAQDVASKKQTAMAALAGQWDAVSAPIPNLISSVKARVDTLGKTKRVPKGVDLSAGNSALADATSLWNKAQSSHSAGNIADAVSAAKDATTKLQAAAEALKLKLPVA